MNKVTDFGEREQRQKYSPKRERKFINLHNEEIHGLYTLPKPGGHIKNEMGEACGAYGGEEKRTEGFGEETRSKEATWKNYAQMEKYF